MKLESALRKPKRGMARDCLHEAQTEECFLSIFVGFLFTIRQTVQLYHVTR